MRTCRLASISLALVAATIPPAGAQRPESPSTTEPSVVAPDLRSGLRTERPPPLFDPDGDPEKDIAAGIARAKREGRRLLILWGADWCSWSRGLHGLLSRNERLRNEVAAEYEVVRVDVGRYDRNSPLLASYGIDLARARIPVVTILDEDGGLLLSEDSAFLESRVGRTKGFDIARVQEFLVRYRAAPRSAEAAFSSGLAAAAKAKKSLLVHFEVPLRAGCRLLEEWLESPEVRAVLAKDFVVLKIDARRMADGFSLLARLRDPDAKGLPWMAVFDPNGKLVATSETDGCRNIEFPQSDEDIAHFGAMLRKGAFQLFPDDVRKLADSLRAVRTRRPASAQPSAVRKPRAEEPSDDPDTPPDEAPEEPRDGEGVKDG